MTPRLLTFCALLTLALTAHSGARWAGSFDGQRVDGARLTEAGFEIATSVYTPAFRRHPGAIVLCHGISASREHMDPMARALARRGHLVVTFDYGGHGRSQDRPGLEAHNVADVRAAVALAREAAAAPLDPLGRPLPEGADASEREPGPVGVVGHSMGVTSAAAVAQADPDVVALVALGQRPFVDTAEPPWLLMADGTQDLFHPYANLRAVISEAAGRDLVAGETGVGETGAFRRLFLSGSCEHAGEVYDGAILAELAWFLAVALDVEGNPDEDGSFEVEQELRAPLAVSLRVVSQLAAAAALCVLGLLLAPAWVRRTDDRLADPSGPPDRATDGSSAPATGDPPSPTRPRRKLAAVLAIAPVGCLGLARALGSPDLGALAVALLLGVLVCGAVLAHRAAGAAVNPRRVLAVGAVLLAGWLGGTLLGAAPAFLAHPELLEGAPLYLWQGVAFRFAFSVDALAARLAVGNSWPTILGLLVLLGVEIAAPGRLALTLARFAARLTDALGGRFRASTSDAAPAPDAAASRKRTILSAVALLVLLAVAGALFAKRAHEGLLAEEGALGTVASAGLRMLVLPLLAATAALWLGRLVRALLQVVAPYFPAGSRQRTVLRAVLLLAPLVVVLAGFAYRAREGLLDVGGTRGAVSRALLVLALLLIVGAAAASVHRRLSRAEDQ